MARHKVPPTKSTPALRALELYTGVAVQQMVASLAMIDECVRALWRYAAKETKNVEIKKQK